MLLFSKVLNMFSYTMEKNPLQLILIWSICIKDKKDTHKEIPAYACTEKVLKKKKKKFETWKKFRVRFCFI